MRGLLLLSFKQASLLAVEKYCQLVPHQVKRGEVVLTPLAGAVFSKFEMPKLAEALGEPLEEVVVAVIRQKRIELTMYVYTYICTLGWTLKYGNEIVLFILCLIEMYAITKNLF